MFKKTENPNSPKSAGAKSNDSLIGHLGHLSPEQEEALQSLKDSLKADGFEFNTRHDDNLFLRFLRARKFNVLKAKRMFLDCEAWRKEYKVEELKETFKFSEKEEVAAIYPRYYHKTDKKGRPIYIEQLGALEIKALFAVTTEERMSQNHVVEYEKLLDSRLPACSTREGRQIEQSFTILDLKGVSLVQFAQAFGFVKRTSAVAQNYYPEMLGVMFIINAPLLFSSCWSMIKTILDEATVAKIHILGSNYKKQLLEYVDAENLPEVLGGNCRCSPNCQQSDAGPWTDPKYNGGLNGKTL